MPTPKAPAAPEPPPKIGGVTTAARAARAAGERPPTPATLGIQPSASDLAEAFRLDEPRPPAATLDAPEEEPPPEETAESEEPVDAEEAPVTTEEEPAEEEQEEPTEEPAAEPEPETAPDPNADPEDANLPPEAIAIRDSMQKRIDKLTAQRAELRERLEEAEQAGTGDRMPAPAEQPLAHVTTEAELEKTLETARAVKQWAIRHRDGGEVQGKEGPVSYDAEAVSEMLANAEATLDAAPQRKEWLQQCATARQIAQQQAPDFYKPGTREQQMLTNTLRNLPPAVKAWRPDIELILIQAFIGSQVLANPAPSNPKPHGRAPAAPTLPSVKPAPAAPGGRTAPKAPAKVLNERTSADQNARIARGDDRALEAAIAAQLHL